MNVTSAFPQAARLRIATLQLVVICFFTLTPTIATPNDFQTKLDAAIASIGSSDRQERERAAAFLLSSPQVFRDKIVTLYRGQIGSLAAALPQQIDSYTTAETVIMTDQELTFGYRVHIDQNILSPTDAKSLRDEIRSQMVAEMCTNPGAALYMLFGHTITRTYSYGDGSYFFQSRLTWSDCESR